MPVSSSRKKCYSRLVVCGLKYTYIGATLNCGMEWTGTNQTKALIHNPWNRLDK